MDRPLLLIENLISRKAKEFSVIFRMYFKAGWKELAESLMNWLSPSLLEEVTPTQSSRKRL